MSLAATSPPRRTREPMPVAAAGPTIQPRGSQKQRSLIPPSLPDSAVLYTVDHDHDHDDASKPRSLATPDIMYPPRQSCTSLSSSSSSSSGGSSSNAAASDDQAPAVPPRSARRVSRMLDDLNLKLTPEVQPPYTPAAPHDVYLSSEEDASSSADDFSEFEYESGSDEAQSSAASSVRRTSREDTARVVSVVFSGKPSIVDLPRRSISPSSSDSLTLTPLARLRRTSALPTVDRRTSVCSTVSTSASAPTLPHHPPRVSSMDTQKRLEKQRPQFLNIDPYADRSVDEEPTPRTPSGMFKRTLSLVRKRSRPALNPHYAYHAAQSRENLSALPTPPYHMELVREGQESCPSPAPQSTRAPTYQEIVNSAKRRTQTMPLSPMSPMTSEPASPMTPRNRLRQGISAAKRRSIRA